MIALWGIQAFRRAWFGGRPLALLRLKRQATAKRSSAKLLAALVKQWLMKASFRNGLASLNVAPKGLPPDQARCVKWFMHRP